MAAALDGARALPKGECPGGAKAAAHLGAGALPITEGPEGRSSGARRR
jgi:hypothetical protein